jgi:hypothetical protein
MTDAGPASRPFIAAARANLAWLLSEGFTEVKAKEGGASFSLYFVGPQARIMISVDLARGSEIDVFLGPPDQADATAPLNLLRDERVALDAILRARNHSPVGGYLTGRSVEERVQSLEHHLEALKLLRETELQGDWSKLAEAGRQGEMLREAAFDQGPRDPALRAAVEEWRKGTQ